MAGANKLSLETCDSKIESLVQEFIDAAKKLSDEVQLSPNPETNFALAARALEEAEFDPKREVDLVVTDDDVDLAKEYLENKEKWDTLIYGIEHVVERRRFMLDVWKDLICSPESKLGKK